MDIDSLKRNTRTDRIEDILQEKKLAMPPEKQEEIEDAIKTYEIRIDEFKDEVTNKIKI
jgi:hypothetical protein